jgi:hypothetical protein
MLKFKLTHKLESKLGFNFVSQYFSKEENITHSLLGDWIVSTFTALRKPYVLFLNEKTLFNIMITFSPKESLLERFKTELNSELRRLGIQNNLIENELKTYDKIGIKKEVNKVITGYLVESIKAAQFYFTYHLDTKGYYNLKEIQCLLNDNPHVKTDFVYSEEYVKKIFEIKRF